MYKRNNWKIQFIKKTYYEISHKILFLGLLLMLFPSSISYGQQDTNPPKEEIPLVVNVDLVINKIYNINSLNETYQVDGYVIYTWFDDRVKFNTTDSLPVSKFYENEKARKLLNNEIWFPEFEFMNVQGAKEAPSIRLSLWPDGMVEYEERFFATCSSKMDYRKFPFDSQKFQVSIETFSYDSSELIFKDNMLFLEGDQGSIIGEDWEIINSSVKVIAHKYKYLEDPDDPLYDGSQSRVVFEIEAKRLSGYYEWQVLFPLLIIILASFVIFWIKEFSSQISVGFTLMLTVVAFNFYSASILPKLPYNTFIEYVILIGYIFIFLGIVAVVINHRINDVEKDKIPLLKYFRYGFPLVYAMVMILLYLKIIYL